MNNYNCEFTFRSDSKDDSWYSPPFNNESVIKNPDDNVFYNLKNCTTDLCVIKSESVNGEINYYQISYNAHDKEIYLYEVKENGDLAALDENGIKNNPFSLGRMFSGVTLEEGNGYAISLEDNKLNLTTSNDSFMSESGVDIIIENTENLAIAENIEGLSEFVNSDGENDYTNTDEDSEMTSDESSESENSELSVAVDTSDENAATFQVQAPEDVTLAPETENMTTVPENNAVPTESSDSGSGSGTLMTVLLIVVAVIALICGGGAAYFFMQLKKEKQNTENLTAQLSQQKENNKQTMSRSKSENAKITELNEIISGYEQTIAEKNTEIKELTEYKQKVDKEIRPVLLNQEDKIKQSQSDIAALEKQVKDKDSIISSLNEKIQKQESAIAELQSRQNTSAGENEADKAASQSGGSVKNTLQEIVKNISLSPETADEFSNKFGAVFMNINTLLTGDVILSESSSYKAAPLICISTGNNMSMAVCLNPYYYRDLPDNNETYDNIMRVKNVFEITGLHNRSGYGLEYIEPATAEKVSDGYKINKMGKIIVK